MIETHQYVSLVIYLYIFIIIIHIRHRRTDQYHVSIIWVELHMTLQTEVHTVYHTPPPPPPIAIYRLR